MSLSYYYLPLPLPSAGTQPGTGEPGLSHIMYISYIRDNREPPFFAFLGQIFDNYFEGLGPRNNCLALALFFLILKFQAWSLSVVIVTVRPYLCNCIFNCEQNSSTNQKCPTLKFFDCVLDCFGYLYSL